MKTRRLLILTLLALVLLLGGRVINQRLWSQAEERESHLLSIHCAISQHLWEHPDSFSSDLGILLGEATSPSAVPRLLQPFPDGLIFTRRGERGFTLGEPHPRRISLLTEDRLVATDEKLPYWESSGKEAIK